MLAANNPKATITDKDWCGDKNGLKNTNSKPFPESVVARVPYQSISFSISLLLFRVAE